MSRPATNALTGEPGPRRPPGGRPGASPTRRRSCVGRVPQLPRARSVAAATASCARTSNVASIASASTELGELQRHYVDVFDLSRKHALYLSYWTDGDTRRRGEVLLRLQGSATAPAASSSTPTGELHRLPPAGARVRRPRRPGGRDAPCCRSTDRASSCLRLALLETDPTYAGVVAAVCATLPGASPLTGRRSTRWPRRVRRARTSGSSPTTRGCFRCQRRLEVPDEPAPVGRPSLRRAGPARRRHDLALPLRPVRLDDPVVPALRVAAAADRLAALPLRAGLRPRRARRRAGHPQELDRGGRRQPAPLPRQRPGRRRPRGPLHAGGRRDPGLPPAHDRAGLHGHHPQRQGDVRRSRRQRSCSG